MKKETITELNKKLVEAFNIWLQMRPELEELYEEAMDASEDSDEGCNLFNQFDLFDAFEGGYLIGKSVEPKH